MNTYFVQLINKYTDKKLLLLSGAVLAESKEDAERKAIEIASTYRDVLELDTVLSLYTLIELTDESPAQFSVEHR